MFSNFLRFKILLTIFVLVLADQILKNAVLAFLVMPKQINDFLSLEIYNNYGVAFGLPVSSGLFCLGVFIFFIFIFVGWKKRVWGNWREMNREKIFVVALIITGALGNIIDRVRFGYIIDYINIGGTVVFNLADVFILGGVLILLSGYLPQLSFGRKGFKKRIYIILFTVLGIILTFLIHMAVEIWYINLLITDFSRYSLGFSWSQWYTIHGISTVILFAGGVLFGYLQGKHWWKVLYEKQ